MQRTQTGITGFGLKIAAIIGMTANHVAHAFIGQLPVFACELLYWLGGLTFPIMAFLLVEGYRHTSSVPRYLARLLVFAALSQVPFTLLFGWTANVLFTLALGLGIIWFFDQVSNTLARAGVLFAGLTVSLFCDWAVMGPLIICLFYVLRTRANGILLTMAVPAAMIAIPALCTLVIATVQQGGNGDQLASTMNLLLSFERFADATRMTGLPIGFANTIVMQVCQLGYALVGFTLACVLMLNYNGRRGYALKWVFYAYYPAHLLIIWLAKLAIV